MSRFSRASPSPKQPELNARDAFERDGYVACRVQMCCVGDTTQASLSSRVVPVCPQPRLRGAACLARSRGARMRLPLAIMSMFTCCSPVQQGCKQSTCIKLQSASSRSPVHLQDSTPTCEGCYVGPSCFCSQLCCKRAVEWRVTMMGTVHPRACTRLVRSQCLAYGQCPEACRACTLRACAAYCAHVVQRLSNLSRSRTRELVTTNCRECMHRPGAHVAVTCSCSSSMCAA